MTEPADPPDPGDPGDHPVSRLDDTVHQRVRLGILAVLQHAERAEFTYLRSALDLTDGNLSRHLAVLEEAGYVEVLKAFEGRRPRTSVRATPRGRAALAAEMAALRELVGVYDGAPEGGAASRQDRGRGRVNRSGASGVRPSEEARW